MPLDPQQTVFLADAQGRSLGTVSLARIEGNRVFGRFAPDTTFATVQSLFEQFEQAVNDQLFVETESLSSQIDGLGLRLTGPNATEQLALSDVQIMNAVDLSCRVPNLALTQIPRAVA